MGLCAAGATIKGCMRVGLRLLVFTVHPMQAGATLMSSFLFNVALVLLATNAAIQFCAQAFALYANETAIHDIWGNQVLVEMKHPTSLLGHGGQKRWDAACVQNRDDSNTPERPHRNYLCAYM